MFGYHHKTGRHAGRHGSRSWGPITVEWDVQVDGEGGRGRGRRRMFDGGELRLVLLKLIEESPRHGYDLIREIEERTGGVYAPSPGVVYPTLTMLADMDMIGEQAADGAKKVFEIKTAGQALLTEREAEVEALMARLADLGSRKAKTQSGPVRRAMGNLRSVLQQKLGMGDASGDTLHEIASILDEAAQRIERL